MQADRGGGDGHVGRLPRIDPAALPQGGDRLRPVPPHPEVQQGHRRGPERREAPHAPQKRAVITGTKYLLLKNAENLEREEKVRLKELLAVNHRLTTLYILKEDLKHLWEYVYEGSARKWFEEWYHRAIYSKIEPLKKFARTLASHLDGILAHCRHRMNTSVVEGINNKAKVIKRVAYGYRDMEYYFLRLRGMIPGVE